MDAIRMDGDTIQRALTASSPYLLCCLILLVLLEQLSYLRKKGPLPGPYLIVPFLGSAVPMIRNPTRFWERQAALAKSSSIGFSVDYLVGRFILFVRSTELSYKIFANVWPEAFHLIGHAFNKKLFIEHNLIYISTSSTRTSAAASSPTSPPARSPLILPSSRASFDPTLSVGSTSPPPPSPYASASSVVTRDLIQALMGQAVPCLARLGSASPGPNWPCRA